jgi:hypothetical protein
VLDGFPILYLLNSFLTFFVYINRWIALGLVDEQSERVVSYLGGDPK